VLVALVIATVGSFGLAGLAVADRADRATELTVLDVGQGDAILLESARGSRRAGRRRTDPDRLLVALDERIPAWDRRLDVVVLTHPHEDHVAGLGRAARALRGRASLRAGYARSRSRLAGMGRRARDDDHPARALSTVVGCASTRSG
jgi:competence protein ComEC